MKGKRVRCSTELTENGASSIMRLPSGTSPGEVTEWPIVRHWKCRVGVKPHRGFESPPLRFPSAQF
jgi:hypothetical protein